MDDQETLQGFQPDNAGCVENDRQDAAAIRPSPNGITGFVKKFAILAMVLGPLVAMAEFRNLRFQIGFSAIVGNAILAFMFCMAVFAFIAGYVILCGSAKGRSVAYWFLFFTVVHSRLLAMIVGHRGVSYLGYAVAVGCWLLFRRDEVCINNYNFLYREIPIRSTLTLRGKRAWLVWGIFTAVVNVILLVQNVADPDIQFLNGFHPLADRQADFSVSLAGETLLILCLARRRTWTTRFNITTGLSPFCRSPNTA